MCLQRETSVTPSITFRNKAAWSLSCLLCFSFCTWTSPQNQIFKFLPMKEINYQVKDLNLQFLSSLTLGLLLMPLGKVVFGLFTLQILLNRLIDRTCSLECAFPWWRFCFGCSGTRLYCLRGWTMWWVSRCVFVASLSSCDHQRNNITFKGFGGSPDETGETALDAMIMDGYDVRSSCYSTNSLQFHLV